MLEDLYIALVLLRGLFVLVWCVLFYFMPASEMDMRHPKLIALQVQETCETLLVRDIVQILYNTTFVTAILKQTSNQSRE